MRRWGVLIALVAAWTVILSAPAFGLFTEPVVVGGNTFSTATLEPPGSMSGSSACEGADSASVMLTWVPSTTSFADGYVVYRGAASGGPYSPVATLTGGGTTGHTDLGLGLSATYYYVVQSTGRNWSSANSAEVVVATPDTC